MKHPPPTYELRVLSIHPLCDEKGTVYEERVRFTAPYGLVDLVVGVDDPGQFGRFAVGQMYEMVLKLQPPLSPT